MSEIVHGHRGIDLMAPRYISESLYVALQSPDAHIEVTLILDQEESSSVLEGVEDLNDVMEAFTKKVLEKNFSGASQYKTVRLLHFNLNTKTNRNKTIKYSLIARECVTTTQQGRLAEVLKYQPELLVTIESDTKNLTKQLKKMWQRLRDPLAHKDDKNESKDIEVVHKETEKTCKIEVEVLRQYWYSELNVDEEYIKPEIDEYLDSLGTLTMIMFDLVLSDPEKNVDFRRVQAIKFKGHEYAVDSSDSPVLVREFFRMFTRVPDLDPVRFYGKTSPNRILRDITKRNNERKRQEEMSDNSDQNG